MLLYAYFFNLDLLTGVTRMPYSKANNNVSSTTSTRKVQITGLGLNTNRR